MTPKKPEEYGSLNILNQKELADLLGVCVATIQKMRKDEQFPLRKNFPGKKGWLYKDILKYVENVPVEGDDTDDAEESVA
jgi:predicted DNA-binding transcriptional regulator AlpA